MRAPFLFPCLNSLAWLLAAVAFTALTVTLLKRRRPPLGRRLRHRGPSDVVLTGERRKVTNRGQEVAIHPGQNSTPEPCPYEFCWRLILSTSNIGGDLLTARKRRDEMLAAFDSGQPIPHLNNK